MFTNKKKEGINRFVCDVSLYVAETPKASIKYHKPPLPIIPFGIVAYGFLGQPFSKQLYSLPYYYRYLCNKDSLLFPRCVLKIVCRISLSLQKKINILINVGGRHCQKNWMGCATSILKPIACFQCFIPNICDFPSVPCCRPDPKCNLLFSELKILK